MSLHIGALEISAAPSVAPVDDSTSLAVIFDGVSFAFDDHVVLRDISFGIAKGSMTMVLGPSGAGKSVILKLILGLLRPDSGRILVNGERIDTMTERELIRVRGDVGMLFQESALFDSLTVADNVGYHLYEETDMPKAQVRRRVEEVLGLSLSRTTSTGCRPNCPVGSGDVWRSPARWRPTRGCCCSTTRRPDSIRLPRRRLTMKS